MPSTELATIEPGGFVALTTEGADVKEIIDELLGGEALSERDLPKVKIPSGGATTWEVPGPMGLEPAKELRGILVHFKHVRGYWPDEQATGTPPACHSQGPDHSAIGIGTPGGECKTCPLAQFGSDPKNGRGQACSKRELWFLLQEGTYLPLVLSMSPASLQNAGAYRKTTLANAGIRMTSVVTALTLEADTSPDGDKYARVVPKIGGRLTPEEAKAAQEYAASFRPSFDAAASAMAAEGADEVPWADGPEAEPVAA